jgi:uncharacterized protein YbbK (DUF523 family)
MVRGLNGHTRIMISACLLGIPCQYDGQPAKRQLHPRIRRALQQLMIPVCPEQLAGLPTPRTPVEIINGDGGDVLRGESRILSQDGTDHTAMFVRGAELTLQVARLTGASAIITQKRSPSCGSAGIYDGAFSHTLRPGCGVCVALLQSAGILLWDVDVFEAAFPAAPD